MGRKSRNKNKSDRDEFAVMPSSSRKERAYDEGDLSDAESYSTNATLDDDMLSVTNDDDNESAIDTSEAVNNLAEYLENAGHKRVPIRIAAMDILRRILMRCSIADELMNWKSTILDVIEKALRRTDEEICAAAVLAALVSIQLGSEINEEIETALTIMREICTDPAKAESVRVHCINAVALCSYLSVTQADSLCAAVSALRTVWTSTKVNTPAPSVFDSAIASWVLLIGQAGKRSLEAALQDQPKLCLFLGGAQVSIRIAAAEALGVLYEAACEIFGEDYHFPNHNHLLEMLESLITDSVKYRTKKDRRLQRSTVRHVYSALRNQETSPMRIRFASEVLILESLSEKLLYSFICNCLRGGLNTHLKTNLLLRELFSLGPPQVEMPTKIPKLQRLAVQNALNKERDIKRSKQRDKRAC
uniref:Interferon-related developmental regulator 1 n=1 Tax=Syphacia muris TaxID=451379 RepID=A0A0N5A7V5_9BILA